MRCFTILLAALLSGATLQLAAAGDDADAILAKAAKAHRAKGGDDKSEAYRGKNKGTIYIAGLELEFTQEIWVQQPGKFKEVMQVTVMNVPVKTTAVFNGKEGWLKVNDMDIKVEKELLEEFQEMSYWMRLSKLEGLKEQGMKFSLLGEVQVNAKPAIGVRISKEGKKDISMYFDKATGLTAKTERRTRDFMSGQETTEERIITAYQEVAGRMLPKRVTVNRDGKKLMEADVQEARVLERLDDSDFAQP